MILNSNQISYILAVICFLCFISCKKNEEDGPSYIPTNTFYVNYEDTNGENILNNDSKIDILYNYKDTIVKVEQNNLDYPNGYLIESIDSTDNLYLRVFIGNFLSSDNNIFYIDFDNHKRDTFKCEFFSSGLISKVWHNNILTWDKEENELILGNILIKTIK